jgi:hypothetical protein
MADLLRSRGGAFESPWQLVSSTIQIEEVRLTDMKHHEALKVQPTS